MVKKKKHCNLIELEFEQPKKNQKTTGTQNNNFEHNTETRSNRTNN